MKLQTKYKKLQKKYPRLSIDLRVAGKDFMQGLVWAKDDKGIKHCVFDTSMHRKDNAEVFSRDWAIGILLDELEAYGKAADCETE